MFEAVYSKDARRTLRRMPRNTMHTIIAKVDGLATDPLAPNNNVTALRGIEGFRLRVGDWRVLYSLDTDANLLRVAAIVPRGEACQ